MAKLISIIEADRFCSCIENWELDNQLEVSICFSEEYDIGISSPSGDVADQVFERLKKTGVFEKMRLISTWGWRILIDPALLKDFMEQVEAIDTKTLRKGNVY